MFDAWCFVSVDSAYKPICALYLRLAFAPLWVGLHAESTCHRKRLWMRLCIFRIVSFAVKDIDELFTFSIALVVACLRTWVGSCMHEALFECLMLAAMLVLFVLTNPCMCCINDARLLHNGLGFMQLVRVIESGFGCDYIYIYVVRCFVCT